MKYYSYYCQVVVYSLLIFVISCNNGQEIRFPSLQHGDSSSLNEKVFLNFDGIVNGINKISKEKKITFANSIKKIVAALLSVKLQYDSQFPTAATSFNISEQCKIDSLNYLNSFKQRTDWALNSKHF